MIRAIRIAVEVEIEGRDASKLTSRAVSSTYTTGRAASLAGVAEIVAWVVNEARPASLNAIGYSEVEELSDSARGADSRGSFTSQAGLMTLFASIGVDIGSLNEQADENRTNMNKEKMSIPPRFLPAIFMVVSFLSNL